MSHTAVGGQPPMTTSREHAFAAFYQHNVEALARALSASLGDPHLAMDATQEAMARACERWDRIAGYDSPIGWCYRVGMNWATSRWRKRRREVVTDQLPQPTRVVDGPDIELEDRMLRALRTLPTDQRSVIVLRLVEDWSIERTAQALGVAPGTVQSRCARALKRLRAELQELESER